MVAPLRFSPSLALGLKVEQSYLARANSRCLQYVRGMGFGFAPLQILFIFTDRLVMGTPDLATLWVRVPFAMILLSTALLTFIRSAQPFARFLLFVHASAWQIGQILVCHIENYHAVGVFTCALVFLAAPLFVFYEPFLYFALSFFSMGLYSTLLFLVAGQPARGDALGYLVLLTGAMLIGCVLAILTWERNLREWNHLAIIEENERRMKQELVLAERVQRGLLPRAGYIDERVSIDFCYLPANNVGGDMLDIIRLDSGVYGLLVADVSGHGFASALIASMMKMLVHAMERPLLHAPGELLGRIDQLLQNQLHNEFITATYCLVDLNTNTLTYATAGHEAPILFNENNLQSLPSGGRALGVFPGSKYRTFERSLQGNEMIFLFTDGCFEAREPGGDILGMENFSTILSDAAPTGPGAVAAIVDRIRLVSGGILDDDVTLLACKLHTRK